MANRPISDRRLARLKEAVDRRQLNWTVVLENVIDGHNLAAVLRSCDAVGVQHVFVLHTEAELRLKKQSIGQKTSGGTARWLDLHFYQDRQACFEHVRQYSEKIFCARLVDDAVPLFDLDLSGSICLLFGNEKDGVTPETAAACDGSFVIPMYGLTQSLNISVACAVSLYAGLRERTSRNMYTENPTSSPQQRKELLEQYQTRHEQR